MAEVGWASWGIRRFSGGSAGDASCPGRGELRSHGPQGAGGGGKRDPPDGQCRGACEHAAWLVGWLVAWTAVTPGSGDPVARCGFSGIMLLVSPLLPARFSTFQGE